MISSNLQSILDNRLRYLPDITAKAIASVDWATKLSEIARGYGLHMDEVEDLQSVVMRSMVGMIPPQNFEQELISALALSPANAEKIIGEINANVFQPIHDFVMAGGKAPDGMVSAGLHVEESLAPEPEHTPSPLEAVGALPLSKGETTEHSSETTNELVLPEVVKSAPVGGVALPPLPRGGGTSEASDGGMNVRGKFEEIFFPEPSGDSTGADELFADSDVIEVQ
jgi:hypothetical protein